MKKTMIYLPEETHEGLKKLAFEAKTSLAELIRRAVDMVYREDIEDMRDMEEELAKYRREPGYAMNYDEFWQQERERRKQKAASKEAVSVREKGNKTVRYQVQSDSTTRSKE